MSQQTLWKCGLVFDLKINNNNIKKYKIKYIYISNSIFRSDIPSLPIEIFK
jgi:hypothetical protein